MRLFVSGVWPGEHVKVKVVRLKSRLGWADLVEITQPDPRRVAPPCRFHGQSSTTCGGCPWMFVSYSAQLEAKQQRVEQALARLEWDAKVHPIWGAPQPLGYRTRAQLKTDGRSVGFVASESRKLVGVDDCLVLTEVNRQTLKQLHTGLPQPSWRPQRRQQWTTLDIDETVSTDTVSVNQRLPFAQANADQNQRMRQWLKAKLDYLHAGRSALELFAGSGNFTELLQQSGFVEIVAVEVVEEALHALRQRNWDGVKPVACDLFEQGALAKLLARYDEAELLLLDPPREGLKSYTGEIKLPDKLRDILYISCDLATFCRDVALFKEKGFELLELQPLDMFPQTPHVEILAHLHRKRP